MVRRRSTVCHLSPHAARLVRVSSNPAIGYALEVTVAREVLRDLTKHLRHTFWADGISVLDRAVPGVIGTSQLTDAYLLGLAVHRRGRLATLDQGIARWAGAAADRVETLQSGLPTHSDSYQRRQRPAASSRASGRH